MEIDITRFFATAEPSEFSASALELGQDAGRITWRNARREAAETPLLVTEDQIDEFRDHVRGFGAWSQAEIMALSHNECNALLVQLISGDIREAGLGWGDDEENWKRYEEDIEAGNIAGRISRGNDGRVYYYVGE